MSSVHVPAHARSGSVSKKGVVLVAALHKGEGDHGTDHTRPRKSTAPSTRASSAGRQPSRTRQRTTTEHGRATDKTEDAPSLSRASLVVEGPTDRSAFVGTCASARSVGDDHRAAKRRLASSEPYVRTELPLSSPERRERACAERGALMGRAVITSTRVRARSIAARYEPCKESGEGRGGTRRLTADTQNR